MYLLPSPEGRVSISLLWRLIVAGVGSRAVHTPSNAEMTSFDRRRIRMKDTNVKRAKSK